MIIFGARSTLRSQEPTDYPCPVCNDRLELQVWQRYAHVFWIPMFPTRKDVVLSCRAQHWGVADGDIPEDLIDAIESLEERTRQPWYLYIGSIGLVLFICLASLGDNSSSPSRSASRQSASSSFGSSELDDNSAEYLATPATGDIYIVHNPKAEDGYGYAVVKVLAVSADSVAFSLGQYGYTSSFGTLSAINNGTVDSVGYFGPSGTVARADLKTFYSKIGVEDVIRR
jgi:hypothetical protein